MLEKVRKLLKEEQFDEALMLLVTIEKDPTLKAKLRQECSLLKAELLNRKGAYQKALELAQVCFKESHAVNDVYGELNSLLEMIESLWHLGKLDEAFQSMDKAKTLLKMIKEENATTHNIIALEARLMHLEGIIFYVKGELHLAQEAFFAALKLKEKIGDQQSIARTMNNIGLIYWLKGELEHALQYYKKSLLIFTLLGNKHEIASCYSNIGIIYHFKGELEHAILNFEESLALAKEIDNQEDVARFLYNLGEVYHTKGELDEALSYFQQSLQIYHRLQNKLRIGETLLTIGEIMFSKRKLNKAYLFFQDALTLFQELGNPGKMSRVYYGLIKISLEKNDLPSAHKYLAQLEEINQKIDSKLVDQQYRLSKAFVLKKSKRMLDKAQAFAIFKTLAHEEIVLHTFTVAAMLNLCEMLLFEIKSTKSQESFQELQALLEKLEEIATTQNSFSLKAETLLLKAKLALLNFQIKEAQALLTRAQKIAEEKGLNLLAHSISDEHDKLLEQLNVWLQLMEENADLEERINLTNVDELLQALKRNNISTHLTQEHDEHPVLLLIIAEGGIVRFSQTFTQKTEISEDLIAAFLSAINSFMKEVLSVSGSIDRIKHHDYTILIKTADSLMLCYVFKGKTFLASKKLNTLIENLKQEPTIWETLKNTINLRLPQHTKKRIQQLITEIFSAEN